MLSQSCHRPFNKEGRMKIDQFQQLVLYGIACLLRDSFPHVNTFMMGCISRGEITGNIKERIREEKDFLRNITRRER